MSVEIALEGARVRYGPLEALHGVDLVVPQGRLTVLLGSNGSGRTTVLRALAGTVALTAGRVAWRGEDVTRTPAYARARRGLSFTPEVRAVFGSLTVAENLRLAAPGGGADVSAAYAAYPELGPLRTRRAATLSGGEQRMLAVARALLSPARLLLLDEPGQGMSSAVRARTHELLGGLAATVVLAEQSLPPGLAAAATVVHELRRGNVVFSGEPAETRAS